VRRLLQAEKHRSRPQVREYDRRSRTELHVAERCPSAHLIATFARLTSRSAGRWSDGVRPARLQKRLVVGDHDVSIRARHILEGKQ
jgi:hypothetical protein